jgi:hypothetical protein
MKNSILKSELFQRTLESFWSDWRLKKEDFYCDDFSPFSYQFTFERIHAASAFFS